MAVAMVLYAVRTTTDTKAQLVKANVAGHVVVGIDALGASLTHGSNEGDRTSCGAAGQRS